MKPSTPCIISHVDPENISPETRVAALLAIPLLACILFACDITPTEKSTGNTFPLIPEASRAGIPDSIIALYREDAYHLAVRYMAQTNSLSIEIPSDLSQVLLDGLLRIYGRRDIPERDTVVDLYPIHVYGYRYQLYEIIVIVNPTFAWTQQWKAGERFSGNTEVDALIRQYDLSVVSYTITPWGSEWAVLRSLRALNVSQLAARFKMIAGVVTAGTNGGVGDGNNIEAMPEEQRWKYTFSLGWGDCFSGCILRRYWDFTVSSDGTVHFVGSRGDGIPPGGPRG
ncbi:MAG TPA: hypothetical protein VNN76_01990 [Bacteroidota bacterium]|nr:hypothetical protein [Bacteroidota bacterium]